MRVFNSFCTGSYRHLLDVTLIAYNLLTILPIVILACYSILFVKIINIALHTIIILIMVPIQQ